jgi:hypothetical protein
MNAAEEVETLRGVCRLLILRILEANAIRELLHENVIKETKKQIPDLIDGLVISYNQNKQRFETQNVEPMKIAGIPQFQQFISTCETPEIVRLAEVTRFVMERETHTIIKAILDKQS